MRCGCLAQTSRPSSAARYQLLGCLAQASRPSPAARHRLLSGATRCSEPVDSLQFFAVSFPYRIRSGVARTERLPGDATRIGNRGLLSGACRSRRRCARCSWSIVEGRGTAGRADFHFLYRSPAQPEQSVGDNEKDDPWPPGSVVDAGSPGRSRRNSLLRRCSSHIRDIAFLRGFRNRSHDCCRWHMGILLLVLDDWRRCRQSIRFHIRLRLERRYICMPRCFPVRLSIQLGAPIIRHRLSRKRFARDLIEQPGGVQPHIELEILQSASCAWPHEAVRRTRVVASFAQCPLCLQHPIALCHRQ